MEVIILGKIDLPKHPKNGVNYLQKTIDRLENEKSILDSEITFCNDIEHYEQVSGHSNYIQSEINKLNKIKENNNF